MAWENAERAKAAKCDCMREPRAGGCAEKLRANAAKMQSYASTVGWGAGAACENTERAKAAKMRPYARTAGWGACTNAEKEPMLPKCDCMREPWAGGGLERCARMLREPMLPNATVCENRGWCENAAIANAADAITCRSDDFHRAAGRALCNRARVAKMCRTSRTSTSG